MLVHHPVYSARVASLAVLWDQLYAAIGDVSACTMIADSSKLPVVAGRILPLLKGIDPYVVHLVRDSRAVAYSFLRAKLRPEITRERAFLPRLNVAAASLRWMITNSLIEAYRPAYAHYMLLGYGHLARNPADCIGQISSFTGVRLARSHDLSNHVLAHALSHTVGGNPMRFRSGPVCIREDDEWESRMPRWQRLLVTALTFPLLRRYALRLDRK